MEYKKPLFILAFSFVCLPTAFNEASRLNAYDPYGSNTPNNQRSSYSTTTEHANYDSDTNIPPKSKNDAKTDYNNDEENNNEDKTIAHRGGGGGHGGGWGGHGGGWGGHGGNWGHGNWGGYGWRGGYGGYGGYPYYNYSSYPYSDSYYYNSSYPYYDSGYSSDPYYYNQYYQYQAQPINYQQTQYSNDPQVNQTLQNQQRVMQNRGL
jgi:hypothetical protein